MGNPRNANGAARRALRRRVAAMGGRCWICTLPIDYSLPALHPDCFELDELTPVSDGGDPLDFDNVAPAHRICNQWRGRKSVQKVEEIRIAAFRAFGMWSCASEFVTRARSATKVRDKTNESRSKARCSKNLQNSRRW